MYACLDYGMRFSPNTIIENNGEEVALALDKYFIDIGSYPNSLDDLVTDYIDDLKPPKTHWGWMYKLEGEEFILGYLYYVDKYSYSIRIFRSTTKDWETLTIDPMDHSVDPFSLGPTPTPTPWNTIE